MAGIRCNHKVIEMGQSDTQCEYEESYTLEKDFGDYLLVDWKGIPCAPAGPNDERFIIHKVTEQKYVFPSAVVIY